MPMTVYFAVWGLVTELSLAPLEDKSGEIIVAIMFGEGKHISGGELGMLYHSGIEFHFLIIIDGF